VKHAAVRTFALAVALAAAGCTTSLSDTVNGLAGDVESLFGASSPPAKYLAELGAVHDGNTCNFKPDAESPLERTRTAVRTLGTCDYATWGEVSYTIQVLAKMADEHPSQLVRAEVLDTLTRMTQRMLTGGEPPEHVTSYPEMIEALKVLKAAHGRDDSDAEFTASVAQAVGAASAFPFERVETPPPDKIDPRATARSYGEQLRVARVVLGAVSGSSLKGFEGDPGVRESLDRASFTVCGAVIRLTLLRAVLGDPSEATRAAAAHDVGVLAIPEAVPVLRTSLIYDGFASVRRESAVALAAYPRDSVVPILIEGLIDEMADVRGAAGRSLESVTGETFGDDRAAWVRWWQVNGAQKTAPGASR
jgi:HEAT repeat protein